MPDRPPPAPRRSVTLDVSTVLAFLLIAAFALIAIVIGWGLVTKALNLTAVISVLATMFSGILAGVLLPRGSKTPPSSPEPATEADPPDGAP